jgi:hypothetical protein
MCIQSLQCSNHLHAFSAILMYFSCSLYRKRGHLTQFLLPALAGGLVAAVAALAHLPTSFFSRAELRNLGVRELVAVRNVGFGWLWPEMFMAHAPHRCTALAAPLYG